MCPTELEGSAVPVLVRLRAPAPVPWAGEDGTAVLGRRNQRSGCTCPETQRRSSGSVFQRRAHTAL